MAGRLNAVGRARSDTSTVMERQPLRGELREMHRRYASHARSGEIEDCVVNVNAVQTLRQRYLISR